MYESVLLVKIPASKHISIYGDVYASVCIVSYFSKPIK